MTRKLYLALDQGGQSSRALVIDHQGQVLTHASEPVTTFTPKPGWVEQNPEQLVETLRLSVKRALAGLSPEQKSTIHSAALVTQRSSLVCWQRDTGEALYPVISWQDRRADDWLANLNISDEWLQKRTGLRASPHYGASKIRWCLDHVQAVKSSLAKGNLCIGPLASFLTARLTFEQTVCADPANASRTLLYNIQEHCWDEDLLKKFAIPESVLPAIVPTIHSFGTLEFDDLRIPLRLVNGDQSAALFSLGRLEAENAYINIGTGAFISMLANRELEAPASLLKSIVYCRDVNGASQFVIEGTVNGAGSALSWAREQLGLEEDENTDLLIDQPDAPPLFINGIGGLGSPFWLPGLESLFIGAAPSKLKLVAVLESIVFLLYVNLKCFQDAGYQPKKMIVSGGLTSTNGFCQKLADVCQIDVWRPNQVEATARGAVYLLADQPGEWQPVEGQWFRVRQPESTIIGERFARWHAALVDCLDH